MLHMRCMNLARRDHLIDFCDVLLHTPPALTHDMNVADIHEMDGRFIRGGSVIRNILKAFAVQLLCHGVSIWTTIADDKLS